MALFFVYIIKTAICLALFYLFYRLLLSNETFHKFNRIALLGLLLLSCLVPFVEITTQQSTEIQQSLLTLEEWILLAENATSEVALVETTAQLDVPLFGWHQVLLLIYWVGIFFFLIRAIYSITKMLLLIKGGKRVKEGRSSLIIHTKEVAPFSWMQYIVISEKDYHDNGQEIIIHEQAHIRKYHSWDLLVVEVCLFFQWFNPAAWLLKQELQNIHEYQADSSVIDQGIDAKKYQLLLIKKAVGPRLYSMANSFNHNSLKKRIAMMLKQKSSPWARAKFLYVLPLAAVAVAAFARPEVSNELNEISAVKVTALTEKMTTEVVKSVENLPSELSVSSTSTDQDVPKKTARTDANGVFIVADKMPEFKGGMQGCIDFMTENLVYPAKAKEEKVQGRVIVQFVVSKDGSIRDVNVIRSIHEELDAEAIRLINNMPAWTPGMDKGEAVDVKYTLPIAFKLEGIEMANATSQDRKFKTATISVEGGKVTAEVKKIDVMPEFKGGIKNALDYIAQEIKYPTKAKEEKVQGRVIVQFIVSKDGSIRDVNVIRSIHEELDAEAIRVVSSMPNWTPGMDKGEAVDAKYTLPIAFKLPDAAETKD